MQRFIPFLVLTAALSWSADFKVIGYFPSWQGEVRDIAYSKVTHINFSFAAVGFGGTVEAPAMGKLASVERAWDGMQRSTGEGGRR